MVEFVRVPSLVSPIVNTSHHRRTLVTNKETLLHHHPLPSPDPLTRGLVCPAVWSPWPPAPLVTSRTPLSCDPYTKDPLQFLYL